MLLGIFFVSQINIESDRFFLRFQSVNSAHLELAGLGAVVGPMVGVWAGAGLP